ncbi:MAG TPA: SRPBCC family protein [Vicinamibacterales bacterium]|jgi:uncharacterized membrane protein|nr:SRPBCC family protein [Vicinamibacterales bacterium]
MRVQQGTADGALAKGLGWFSIGLGLAELAAPGSVAQLIGVRDDDRTRNLLRAYGAREIANGTAILGSGADDAVWLWTRVAGDVLDLATMGAALREGNRTDGRKLAIGMASVGGVLMADVMAARRVGRENGRAEVTELRPRQRTSIRVSKTFTINAPPDEVYSFWRQLDNLPRFMRHLESVEPLGGRISHWVACGPAGMRIEWDAEMIEDTPQRISWRSLDRADVPNSGTVEFRPAPGDRGTELRVRLQYDPPGGKAGKWFAKLFGEEPGQQLYDDLRRVKSLIETGEVAQTPGSSSVSQPAQPYAGSRRRAAGGRR